MAFCRNCGKEIDDKAVVCPNCGVAQTIVNNAVPQAQEDSGSIGWGVLGFFIPIVGLILFLVWKDTKPKCAKNAGIGALVGFITGIVLVILAYVLMFSAMIIVGTM